MVLVLPSSAKRKLVFLSTYSSNYKFLFRKIAKLKVGLTFLRKHLIVYLIALPLSEDPGKMKDINDLINVQEII